MQQKAVIAIGLSVCLITAGVGGYMMYRSSTSDDIATSSAAQKTKADSPEQNLDQAPAVLDSEADIAEDMVSDKDQAGASSQSDSQASDHSGDERRGSGNADRPATSRNQDDIDQTTRKRASEAIERIISKARAHKPQDKQDCSRVKTSAVHRASGVRYNFPTDCLPKGWVRAAERSGPGR